MLRLWLPLSGIWVRCGRLVVWGLALLRLWVLLGPYPQRAGRAVLILAETNIVVVVNLLVSVGPARGRLYVFVVRMG